MDERTTEDRKEIRVYLRVVCKEDDMEMRTDFEELTHLTKSPITRWAIGAVIRLIMRAYAAGLLVTRSMNSGR